MPDVTFVCTCRKIKMDLYIIIPNSRISAFERHSIQIVILIISIFWIVYDLA